MNINIKKDKKNAPIGIIDSGVGGITTLSCLLEQLPNESYIYLADKSGAPYGDKSTDYILFRTMQNCFRLLSFGVKAIVIACNTATNVGISTLRKNRILPLDCIYVGMEPALRPAFLEVKKKKILVLTTPATARQQKFIELSRQFDSGRTIVIPEPNLASIVEKNIHNIEKTREYVYSILDSYHDVGGVVLGCTHYVYLRQIINEFYNCDIKIFDGNLGAALRLFALLSQNDLHSTSDNAFVRFIQA